VLSKGGTLGSSPRRRTTLSTACRAPRT